MRVEGSGVAGGSIIEALPDRTVIMDGREIRAWNGAAALKGLFVRVTGPDLVAAVQTYLLAGLPVSLLLYAVGGDFGPGRLGRLLVSGLILTFSICVCLYIPFAVLWRSPTRRPAWSAGVVGAVGLPAVGCAGALLGMQIVGGLFPEMMAIPTNRVFAFGIPMAVVYGIGLHRAGDFSRRASESLAVLRLARRQQRDLARARERAELVSLRSLVRPHFLFNTLNSLAALIPTDPKRAEDMTVKLSHLLRQTLDSATTELVTLRKELDLTSCYLEIERTRLGERLHWYLDVPDDLLAAPVPNMILQPLVENAVQHGIVRRVSPGVVRISARASDGRLVLTVADNGPGMGPSVTTGVGLRVVKSRLELLYGRAGSFALERVGEETLVVLGFPRGAEGEEP
ncbi:MAG: histidine kinase [Acidobacteria bacterium]|nr:histidine kinase [Acidobacteriota bacterium]